VRVRYATIYHLFMEGVGALSTMKITLSYCRSRGFLPAYYAGFTATCRDEARHVQYGKGYDGRTSLVGPGKAGDQGGEVLGHLGRLVPGVAVHDLPGAGCDHARHGGCQRLTEASARHL
jgi:hypothetical protein